MTTEKIIDLKGVIRERLALSILKKRDSIILRSKHGVFMIMLNPKIEKKSVYKQIIHYLNRIKNIKSAKSIVKITEEECKKILLVKMKGILIKKTSALENQIWEEMKDGIWQKIEKEIINSKGFFYQYKSGSISDIEKSFTYARSLIFSINK